MHRLWLQTNLYCTDSGSKWISTGSDVIYSRWQRPYGDRLASLFYSGKKRRNVVCLFSQSMVKICLTRTMFCLQQRKTSLLLAYIEILYTFVFTNPCFVFLIHERCFYFTFTFMHLADAFIQSAFYSGYTFFCQYMCSLGIEPTTFALLTQCSNHWATGTEPFALLRIIEF